MPEDKVLSPVKLMVTVFATVIPTFPKVILLKLRTPLDTVAEAPSPLIKEFVPCDTPFKVKVPPFNTVCVFQVSLESSETEPVPVTFKLPPVRFAVALAPISLPVPIV